MNAYSLGCQCHEMSPTSVLCGATVRSQILCQIICVEMHAIVSEVTTFWPRIQMSLLILNVETVKSDSK